MPVGRQSAVRPILSAVARSVRQRLPDKRPDLGSTHANPHASSGNLDSAQPFFIASTTKLYTTALILQMRAEGQLNLDDPVGQYLEPNITQGLHEYRGTSHGARITIRQLLAHRSGLPDYFRDRDVEGNSYERRLIEQGDFAWTFEQAIRRSKQLRPRFAPGTAGKAYYSDTNYQLLGRILKVVFQPLDFENSYLFTDPADQRPATMQYRNRMLRLPQAMASFGPDGGIVSTASELAGHSGLSGALLFWSPERDIIVAGTVNRVDQPDLSYRILYAILNSK